MKIIVPIGISGSGKSTMYHKYYSDYKIICPDQIRLELTGDISDQSKNGQVFKMVDQMVDDCIKNNVDFFYDATNLNTKYRKEFTNKVKQNPNVQVIYVVLPANVMVSFQRIQKDLKDGKVRSNVPMDVLHRQYAMYQESMRRGFIGENVDTVLTYDNQFGLDTAIM